MTLFFLFFNFNSQLLYNREDLTKRVLKLFLSLENEEKEKSGFLSLFVNSKKGK